jgi:hypothetical protein
MKLYKITETISESRRTGGDFRLTIVVSRRFLRAARRAARKGDRDAMYRIWYAFSDFAWPRCKRRHDLIDSERSLFPLSRMTAIPNK